LLQQEFAFEAVELGFRLRDDVADQAQGELAANDGELLQEGFLVGREAVDAGGEDTLDGGGNVQVWW
jgi:hypothetical protein